MSAICEPFRALEALSEYLSVFAAKRRAGNNFERSIVQSRILQEKEGLFITTRDFGNALHKVLPSLATINPIAIFSEELSNKLEEHPAIGSNAMGRLRLFQPVKPKSANEKLTQFEKLLEPNSEQSEICRLAFLKSLFNTLDKLICFKRTAAFDLESYASDHPLRELVSSLVVEFNTIQERLNELIESSLFAIGNKLLGEEANESLLVRFKTMITDKVINPLRNRNDIANRAFMELDLSNFGCNGA